MKFCRVFAPCLLTAFVCSVYAQTAPVRPAFDAASIRPSKGDAPARSSVPLDSGNVYGSVSPEDSRGSNGSLFVATHQALWRYISFAYKLSGTQELALRFNVFSGSSKSGAPFWVTGGFNGGADYFDITARAPANTSIDTMRLMMQSLLAERFHLAVHMQSAETPVFAITLVRPGATGPNLKPHSNDNTCGAPAPEPTADSKPKPSSVPSTVGNLPIVCGVIAHVPSDEPGQHYGGQAIPLFLLATSLPTMTGLAALPRPVVDETGLSGLYDFTLAWVHDSTEDEGSVSENMSNFRSALKNQLGVTLKPSRAPIDFLIVDKVEKPSEN